MLLLPDTTNQGRHCWIRSHNQRPCNRIAQLDSQKEAQVVQKYAYEAEKKQVSEIAPGAKRRPSSVERGQDRKEKTGKEETKESSQIHRKKLHHCCYRIESQRPEEGGSNKSCIEAGVHSIQLRNSSGVFKLIYDGTEPAQDIRFKRMALLFLMEPSTLR